MSFGELLGASLLDGLLIGFVYGIAAMGLTLIFGVMDVINLAHGPLIAIGMFFLYGLFTHFGMNPYLAIILVAIGGLVAGIIVYFAAVHRVINAPPLSSLLSTFSVNMIIIGVGTALLSTSAYNVDFKLSSLTIGSNITITGTRIAAAGVAILVTALLYVFLYRTRAGKYIRAVSNNRQAAELMGIPSTRILALAFGIGTMLAMTAGALIATILPINILAGGTYELKSFVIVVLGGLGNPLGALAGGLILGLIEGLVPVFMEATWVPVIEFGLFVLILLVMPNGLFGKKRGS
jgi:branched-chain amino acid transport system permease protein